MQRCVSYSVTMRNILQRPYVAFWLSVPLLIAIGFIRANQEHQFYLEDSKVLFTDLNLFIFLAIVFEMSGILYWFMKHQNRKLSGLLSLLHVILSVGAVAVLSFYALAPFVNFNIHHVSTSTILTVITVAQFIFLLNLMLHLLKK